MGKQIDSSKRSIGEVLGRYERRPVVLPPFQRPYSWEKSQISAFLDDLVEFRQSYAASPVTASYYLGSIVVINSDEQILLLDGQQRLATATIVLAALRDVARTLGQQGQSKGTDFARDVQRELLEKETDPLAYSLTLGELDEEFFRKTVKSDPPEAVVPKLRSHQLIETARTASRSCVENVIKGLSSDAAIKRLKSVQDALTRAWLLLRYKSKAKRMHFEYLRRSMIVACVFQFRIWF